MHPPATTDGAGPSPQHQPGNRDRRLVADLGVLGLSSVAVGVLAGLSSAFFLSTLERVTELRIEHPWLLFLLPFAGLAVGLGYHHYGRGSGAGNNLILDEIHEPSAWIPRRMAGLVYLGTIATHLCGGSAGREGTAIQMAGSLTDGLNRIAKVTGEHRRILLLAAIGGGFSAVFGVPFAGLVFGLEVQSVGRLRLKAAVPTAIAAFVGDQVVRRLGVDHAQTPTIRVATIDPALLAKVVVAGAVCGLMSVVFAESVHRLKHVLTRAVSWPPARPFAGGLAVIALTYVVGTRDYLGLSLPLISASLAGGAGVVLGAFAIKTLFTVVTLGSGFQGGEVTPLFVIGSTLGATLGHALGAPIPLMAALGFVAVFSGATNTPLACTVMGVELFGWHIGGLLLLACVVAYLCSGSGGIYTAQRHRSPVRLGFGHRSAAA